MNNNSGSNQFYMDYFLLLICIALLAIGFVMVTSSSLHLGEKMLNNSLHYPSKQSVHIIMGVGLAGIICCIPLWLWEKFSLWLFVGSILLLLLVIVPGVGITVNGSTRWIEIAGLRLQLSEFAKLASVVYLASYVTRQQQTLSNPKYGWLTPLLLLFISCLLLLLEPDFGSAVVLLITAGGMVFLSGVKFRYFVLLSAVLALAGAALVYFSPYRMARVISFVDPWADAQDSGFQLVQALISFGRGELLGVNLGSGIQKLFYLPAAHTDFLFSVLAEELGLLGVLLVIGLFALLLRHTFSLAVKAQQAEQKFAAFIAYGVGIWFSCQALINMGVNMGMLPTKGLTLPLMSYGGSSMLVMCAASALLFRVHSETVAKQTPPASGSKR